MPLSCCPAARFTASLISSFEVARLATNLNSTTDTFCLGTGGQMGRGLVLRGEDAGAFDRDIDSQVLPRQLPESPQRGVPDRAIADNHGVALDRHLPGKAAMHAVEAQQMRVGLDRPEI